jgi:hypothetical protein
MVEWLKKWGSLIFFVALTLVGVILRYAFGDQSELWSLWGTIDVSFAVSLGILAFFAYRNMVHDEDEVGLYFDVNGTLHDTGLRLLRKDCTRSEIIGVLGMMQRRTKERFNYDSKHLRDLLNEVNRVQKGRAKTFHVPIAQEEYEQFVVAD